MRASAIASPRALPAGTWRRAATIPAESNWCWETVRSASSATISTTPHGGHSARSTAARCSASIERCRTAEFEFCKGALMRAIARAFALGCALFAAGCDQGARAVIEKTVPAQGVLTWQGNPLEDYMVTFYPKDGKRPAAAKTDKAGHFTLGTNGANDGAVPGAHTVTVVYVGPDMHEEPRKEEFKPVPPPKVTIPAKYGDPKTTDLFLEVPAEGSTSLNIDFSP